MVYGVMTVVGGVLLGLGMAVCDPSTAAVLVMLVLQLDSQLLMLFIQRIQF